ncbi:hypothetical protein RR46_15294 [Papilio xuthus]|uniref:Uncharacterized protein n=1 Tax=Papilio xuthus TaxID=66420 RepID=A0A194PL07_PAPXU|nr:hypothetical protein RR46_15294 [Papilio xuthus]
MCGLWQDASVVSAGDESVPYSVRRRPLVIGCCSRRLACVTNTPQRNFYGFDVTHFTLGC